MSKYEFPGAPRFPPSPVDAKIVKPSGLDQPWEPSGTGRFVQVPYLEVTSPSLKRRVPLTDAPLTIGRSATNTVPLDDGQASRAHCVIEQRVEGFCLRDLDSSNGTWCHGEQIEQVILTDGDEFRIGAAVFTFRDGDTPGE